MNKKIKIANTKYYKHEANRVKNELIKIANRMEEFNRPEAERLNRIIARLECWQNNGK
jgi:hypothetical protein